MSRTRSLGLAAYKRLVEAAPAALVDGLDDRLTPFKASRSHSRDLRQAARWARQVSIPSKWYATDGTRCFYFFRKRQMCFVNGDNAFGRLPHTVYGTDAAQAFARHGGQLTDRRPSGWISAATMAGVSYGGLDGGPRDWGWHDNEDLDLDIRTIEQLRAKNPDPYITGHLSEYAEHFGRALAGRR